ncbi:HGGxSTG domain-containing protein [Blastococcus sp. SYSU DS0533]
MRLCGATRRDGGSCRQPIVRGATRCRIHGGSAPQVRRKALEVRAQAIITKDARHYGQPRNISALDALTEELHRTQGHVDWLAQQIAAHPQDPSLLAVYTAERAHLAKLADAMVRNKLDERQAVAGERMVDSLELALTCILRDLGHDPGSAYVRKIVARHLRRITGSDEPEAKAIDGEVLSDSALPEPVAF